LARLETISLDRQAGRRKRRDPMESERLADRRNVRALQSYKLINSILRDYG